MKQAHIIAICLTLGVAVPGADAAQQTAAGKWPAIKRTGGKASSKSEEKTSSEKKKPYGDEKPFNDVVKDMEVIKGLFTFYRKADENKILMEISTNQFNQTFLFAGSIEQSVGERGMYGSQMGGHFPFQFRMVGKQVQWIILNSSFTAAPESPAERALQRSFGNSLMASARIASQPHPERKSMLVNLSDLILSDIPGLAAALKETYKPSDYRFDKNNSSISEVRSFPQNALVEVWLHFASDNPKAQSLTIPDERSIPIVVKYDFSELPATNFRPRYADDRVGHFLSLQQDFTSDKPSSPYIRRIHRWHLEKRDPAADLSEPKEPIVFWLENTIPLEYRDAMREGALLWNKAFERIGFKNAIVVRQQPDNADWDAADTRYNTIRWFAGVDASFAIGPSRANPYTGQIYDADIGFAEGIIRSVRRNYEEAVAPVVPVAQDGQPPARLAWDKDDGAHFCQFADGLAHQAAFGVNVLEARGGFSRELEERLMHEYIVHVTAHEVGHTLGLRHNFRASTMLPPDQIWKDDATEEYGQSASVMDYNPIVLAGKGEKQGRFISTVLGPYDYWAIEYAYKPLLSREDVELARIAGRAGEPFLSYSTDEDALGTFSPNAVDPLVNQFDQSSDPVFYFQKRVEIIKELWSSMEEKLVREGEGYQILRRALVRSLNEYNRALLTSSKFIGGLHHYRDHAGDPGGRMPFMPVPAARQKQALEFLQNNAFSELAFKLEPNLYNKLAAERLPGLGGIDGLYSSGRIDYSWHDSVLNLQRGVLQRLHAPAVLARLQDNELRFAAGEERFRMADLFNGLEFSIWSELDHPVTEISSLRRNLQREHLKTVSRVALRSVGGYPEDATSLARQSLQRIHDKIGRVIDGGKLTDQTSLAHLEETRARVRAALDAQIQKSIE